MQERRIRYPLPNELDEEEPGPVVEVRERRSDWWGIERYYDDLSADEEDESIWAKATTSGRGRTAFEPETTNTPSFQVPSPHSMRTTGLQVDLGPALYTTDYRGSLLNFICSCRAFPAHQRSFYATFPHQSTKLHEQSSCNLFVPATRSEACPREHLVLAVLSIHRLSACVLLSADPAWQPLAVDKAGFRPLHCTAKLRGRAHIHTANACEAGTS